MKTTILLVCFIQAVCAAPSPVTVLEGEDYRNSFIFDVPSRLTQIYLCRLPCGPGDMLLQATGLRIKSGRFVLRLDGQVHVAITRVTKQDEGNYRVGVTFGTSEIHTDFQLKVKDLCDGGVDRDTKREYLVSPGSDLTVLCELPLQPRNRKFLCREDCTAFLVDTNDEGYSTKYGLEYVNRNSFKAILKNVRASDAGRYRCGVGREFSPNYCQEFTVRIEGVEQIDPKNGEPDEGKESGSAGAALAVVVGLLVGIILILVILLIHVRKKKQSAHYVNTDITTTTRPGARPSQPASDNSGVSAYASLRPETRENEYSVIQLQPVPEQTNYVEVID